MALKILIIDPNEEWLYAAKEFFEKAFYQVEVVSNGKDAQLALYNDKYFAVILNLETKNHSGFQVLKFIKTNHGNANTITILEKEPDQNDSEAITVDMLKKMGSNETLIKPFELENLRVVLEGHQSVGDLVASLPRRKGASAEEEVALADDQFTKIRIDEFYTSKPVLFDIFIKIGGSKYVKILHAGDEFEKARVDKYKNEKKMEYFHFQKKDIAKFVKFNNFVTKKLIANKDLSAKIKVKMLHNVAEKYLEQAFTEGMKPQIVDQGKDICKNVYSLIEKQPNLYKLLRSYQDFDPSAFTHAYLVTLFSSMIIKNFEWQSKTTIETTAMACMFHDIGKMALPKKYLEKKNSELSEEELEEYKTHCEKGFEILDGNRLVNNSIKQIVLQHHEAFDGTGFPYGKRGSKILTLANIVCLSDDFVHIIIDQDKKPIEALKVLLSSRDKLTRYNSRIVENLIKTFADPSKLPKESNTTLPSNSHVVNKKVS